MRGVRVGAGFLVRSGAGVAGWAERVKGKTRRMRTARKAGLDRRREDIVGGDLTGCSDPASLANGRAADRQAIEVVKTGELRGGDEPLLN